MCLPVQTHYAVFAGAFDLPPPRLPPLNLVLVELSGINMN